MGRKPVAARGGGRGGRNGLRVFVSGEGEGEYMKTTRISSHLDPRVTNEQIKKLTISIYLLSTSHLGMRCSLYG